MKLMAKSGLLIGLLLIAGSGAAAEGAATTGESWTLMALFFGFFALIIVFQLVPAVIQFVALVRGLFSADSKKQGAGKFNA